MPALSAFLASLLMAWPAPPVASAPADASQAGQQPQPASDTVWRQLAEGFRPSDAAQVRIEQRVIWRITPMPGPTRESLVAIAPRPPGSPRMIERKMGDCVQMGWIAGGRPEGASRLLLFLRDRRMVAANLEKACSARDFYAGFYVDKPNSDGKLCADRDRILARNGARCEISSFRLLVTEN